MTPKSIWHMAMAFMQPDPLQVFAVCQSCGMVESVVTLPNGLQMCIAHIKAPVSYLR